MVAAAVNRSEQDQPDPHRSTIFLARLEAAHDQVEQCIVGLESVMTEPDGAGTADFSVTRLRLGRANLTRTQVAWQACSHLIPTAPSGQAEALRGLQKHEIEHSQAISEHIRRWPPRALQGDWQGYRDATRKVLERARELIALEQKLLLPLLRQAR